MAITQDDAARLQAAEAQVLGPNASGFQVPVGQQPAAGGGASTAPGPFGWPAFGGPGGAFGGGGGGTAPGAHAQHPAAALQLQFAAAPAQGAFVFGAAQQQQQQQQQQHQQQQQQQQGVMED